MFIASKPYHLIDARIVYFVSFSLTVHGPEETFRYLINDSDEYDHIATTGSSTPLIQTIQSLYIWAI
jgi:hypothetical protein